MMFDPSEFEWSPGSSAPTGMVWGIDLAAPGSEDRSVEAEGWTDEFGNLHIDRFRFLILQAPDGTVYCPICRREWEAKRSELGW